MKHLFREFFKMKVKAFDRLFKICFFVTPQMTSIKTLKIKSGADVTFMSDSCVLDATFFKKYSIK